MISITEPRTLTAQLVDTDTGEIVRAVTEEDLKTLGWTQTEVANDAIAARDNALRSEVSDALKARDTAEEALARSRGECRRLKAELEFARKARDAIDADFRASLKERDAAQEALAQLKDGAAPICDAKGCAQISQHYYCHKHDAERDTECIAALVKQRNEAREERDALKLQFDNFKRASARLA